MTRATSTSTVLVVDDEQRLRDLVRGYLEHEGPAQEPPAQLRERILTHIAIPIEACAATSA